MVRHLWREGVRVSKKVGVTSDKAIVRVERWPCRMGVI